MSTENVVWPVILHSPNMTARPLRPDQLTDDIKASRADGALGGGYNCSSTLGQITWRPCKSNPHAPLWPCQKVLEWDATATWVRPLQVDNFSISGKTGIAALVEVLNSEGARVNYGAGPTVPQRYLLLCDEKCGRQVLTLDVEDTLRQNLGLTRERYSLFEGEATIPDQLLTPAFLRQQIHTANPAILKYTRPWEPKAVPEQGISLLQCCGIRAQPTSQPTCKRCGASVEGSLNVRMPFS